MSGFPRAAPPKNRRTASCRAVEQINVQRQRAVFSLRSSDVITIRRFEDAV